MPDNGIKIVEKPDYPGTLKNMPGSPAKLFCRGTFPAPPHYKYVCVVGSRKWTPYGRNAVYSIIGGLRGYPVAIVSGLAMGIDSISHMAAMEAGLYCVAFPGSNLDWESIYPRAHLNLAKKILASGGALLSRWPPGYHTEKWAFPARNALMAGLSHATLIIEAGRHSGSLMTASHAEEYSRDVLAVPGSIDASQSYGPHMLIRKGAALVSSSSDLLRELGYDPAGRENADRKAVNLDGLSSAILDIISRKEATASLIIEQTGASASSVNERLSVLELEGLIKIDISGIAKSA